MRILPVPSLVFLLSAASVTAQTYQWQGPDGPFSPFSTAANWSPSGPPTTGSSVVVDAQGQSFGTGPVLDVDVDLANLTLSNGGGLGVFESDFSLTFSRFLTVSGTTTLGSGPGAPDGVVFASDGCTFTLGTLINQNNTTLTRGAHLGTGNNVFVTGNPAIIEWRGAHIVRNEGNLGLGPNGVLRDQDTHEDALRDFDQNGGSFGVSGRTYVTPGDFTNFSYLSVVTNSSNYPFSRMEIGGTFINFDDNTGVLNGGTIHVKGRFGGRAEFAFPGADIRTLAPFTEILLEGDAAILDSNDGANGLRHLGELLGEFSVASALGVEPMGGILGQSDGNLNVLTDGFLTVTGDFTQSTGATANVGQNGAGSARLAVTGYVDVSGTLNLRGDILATDNDAVVSSNGFEGKPGSTISGSGTIEASDIISDGILSPGTVPGSGPATLVPGRLRLKGDVTFSGNSGMVIGIGGEQPGTGHSVIEHIAGQDLHIGGTIAVTLANGYTPPSGAVFEFFKTDSYLYGEFSNVANEGRMMTTGGEGSFRVRILYRENEEVIALSDYESATNNFFTGLDPIKPFAWEEPLNWSLGVPNGTRPDPIIAAGRQTASSVNYPGLNTLVLRPDSSVSVLGGTTLEFLNGITMEGRSGSSSYVLCESPGTALLATNRITATGPVPNDPGSSSALGVGVDIVQPGNAPAPMTISRSAGGVLYINGSITPFRGSTLTMESGSSLQDGSFLQILGGIHELQPGTPSATGAAVVIDGAGSVLFTKPSTYTGGTTVRNSIRRTVEGYYVISGGLNVENVTGSGTGSGPVTIVSTAGVDGESNNTGCLLGNGSIAGDVVFQGGLFLPGNSYVDGATSSITLGGDLTMDGGPNFGGTRAAELLLDLDPRNAIAVRRKDLILLTSATANVDLTNVSMGIFLKSPPVPGETLRFIDAPNASGAVTGIFSGMPDGSTVTARHFGVDFNFTINYGGSFVELTHVTPPPMSYLYQRTFYFNESEQDENISGPDADYNSDGIVNVMSYALGTDPKQFPAGRLPKPVSVTVQGTRYLAIEIRRAFPLRPDLDYFVGESTDLVGFGTPIDIDDPANLDRIVSRTNHGDGTETVVVRAAAAASSEPRQFLRFSVDYTP